MMSRDRLLHASHGAKPESVGHRPSFRCPEIPAGFALGVSCWRLITARQLGFERCSGYDHNTLQPASDPLAPKPRQ